MYKAWAVFYLGTDLILCTFAYACMCVHLCIICKYEAHSAYHLYALVIDYFEIAQLTIMPSVQLPIFLFAFYICMYVYFFC